MRSTEELIRGVVAEYLSESVTFGYLSIIKVRTFEDVGIQDVHDGVVVYMSDGTEYQLTVMRSK